MEGAQTVQYPAPFAGSFAAPMSFGEACELVVGYVKQAVPLAFWSVTRHDRTPNDFA